MMEQEGILVRILLLVRGSARMDGGGDDDDDDDDDDDGVITLMIQVLIIPGMCYGSPSPLLRRRDL